MVFLTIHGAYQPVNLPLPKLGIRLMSKHSLKWLTSVFALFYFYRGIYVQLDCPSVRSWELVGTMSYLGQISNLRPVLDSSAQTTRGYALDFFVKPKNDLV